MLVDRELMEAPRLELTMVANHPPKCVPGLNSSVLHCQEVQEDYEIVASTMQEYVPPTTPINLPRFLSILILTRNLSNTV